MCNQKNNLLVKADTYNQRIICWSKMKHVTKKIICWSKLICVTKKQRTKRNLAVENFITCYCIEFFEINPIFINFLLLGQLTTYYRFIKLSFHALRTSCSFKHFRNIVIHCKDFLKETLVSQLIIYKLGNMGF